MLKLLPAKVLSVPNAQRVSPLIFSRQVPVACTLNSTLQVRGGKVNFSKRPAKLFEKRYMEKSARALANRKKKKTVWVQPKNMTREQLIEQAKPKISDRQKELIQQIITAGETGQTLHAFDAYKRLKVSPDQQIYLSLLKACRADGGFLGEAIQIYHDMKKHNLVLTVEIFQTLIDICTEASHLPRAIYFLKEMLNRFKFKPSAKLLALYESILKLCVSENAPNRAMMIYKLMVDKKLFKPYKRDALHPLDDLIKTIKFTPSFVPLEYINRLIDDKEKARSFWIEINRAVKPSFNGLEETDNIEAYDEARIEVYPADANEAAFRAKLSMLNNIDRDGNQPYIYNEWTQRNNLLSSESDYRMSARQQILNDAPRHQFYGYSTDPHVNLLNQELWESAYGYIVNNIFDNYLDRTDEERKIAQDEILHRLVKATFGAKPHHIPIIKSIYDDFLTRSYYCTTEDEKGGLIRELLATLSDFSRQCRTKLNWIPIIVGIDKRPFFPKSIGMDMVTEEKIKMAKQEYLDSIEDEDSKKIIQEELFDRIQLRWYDLDRQQVVQGLVY
jgi:hypothetical protein